MNGLNTEANNTTLVVPGQLDIVAENYPRAEINTNYFEITGRGIYSSEYAGGVPSWIDDYVQATLTNGEYIDANSLLTQLSNLQTEIENGVNVQIIQVNTNNSITNARIDTVKTEIEDNFATVIQDVNTTVSEKASTAEVDALIASVFGDENSVAGSYVNDKLTTYSDPDKAEATTVTALGAVITNPSTGVAATANAVSLLDSVVGITDGVVDGTGLLGSITDLQSQIDREITTWFEDYIPTELVEPWLTWLNTDTTNLNTLEQSKHLGDLFYDTSTGYAYRFIVTTGTYSWVAITDNAITTALANAAAAQDTADGKRRVFYAQPSNPDGNNDLYDVGDLWVLENDGDISGGLKGDIYRTIAARDGTNYSASDWVISASYQTVVNALQAQVASDISALEDTLQGQLDDKVETYYQDDAPFSNLTGEVSENYHRGDLWYCTDETNATYTAGKVYEYLESGSGPYAYTWTETTEFGNSLFDLADRKKTIYTSAPNGGELYKTGDLWITSVEDISNSVVPVLSPILTNDEMLVSANDSNGSFNPNDWRRATKYTDDTSVVELSTGLVNGTVSIDLTSATIDGSKSIQEYVVGEIDKEVVIYSGTDHTAQTGMKTNDIFIEKTINNSGAVPVDVVNTYKYNGSSWDAIGSNDNLTALADLADGKRTIYSDATTATGPDGEDRDIWIPTSGTHDTTWIPREIYQHNGTTWVLATKYTDDTATSLLNTGLVNGTVAIDLTSATLDGSKSIQTYVTEEIDKEVVVYSGADHTLQTGMKANDIYIEKTVDTSGAVDIDVLNTYTYNGASWDIIGNNNNLTALADLADGKRTIYSGASLPPNNPANPLRDNDLFIPITTFTDGIEYVENEMYRYSELSGNWLKATRYDSIIIDLESQLDNKIATYYGGATPPFVNQVNVVKDPRGNDYWYCDTDGTYEKGKIYEYVEVPNGGNFNYTWTVSTDISKGAFDLADKKRTVFGNAGNDIPVAADGLELNDLWIPSSTSGSYKIGKVYKCTNKATPTWAEVDYTNDETVDAILDGSMPLDASVIKIGNNATTLSSYVAAEADKRVHFYSGVTAPVNGQPTGVESGDIYIWFTTATASNEGSTYDVTRTYRYSGTTWNEITTNDEITKIADLADGKRTIYADKYNATPPPAGEIRDVWIPLDDDGTPYDADTMPTAYIPGEIYQFTTVWVLATKYTEDLTLFVNEVNPKINTLQNQTDGTITGWRQTADPATAWTTDTLKEAHHGDVWFDTTVPDAIVVTRYNSSIQAWEVATDLDGVLVDANAYADGKASIYYGTLAERDAASTSWTIEQKANNVGDVWYIPDLVNTDVTVGYRWSGANWFELKDGVAFANSEDITRLTSTVGVDGGELSGSTGLYNTLYVNTERVETNFSYDTNTWINGSYYNAGFGLKTTAGGTGTSVDPYNSEFWIDAEKFRFTNSHGAFGTDVFSIDASNTTSAPQVTFNGVVNFNSSGLSTSLPTHTGGLLADRPATPVLGSTYAATDTHGIVYTYMADGWADGFTSTALATSGTTVINGGNITTGFIQAEFLVASDITAGDISSTAVIRGNKIEGALITGSIIKASYIDPTSSYYLTLPRFVVANPGTASETITAVLLPEPNNTPVSLAGLYNSSYAGHFALGTDGRWQLDEFGYARLITQIPTYLASRGNYNMTPSVSSTEVYGANVYRPDDFTIEGQKLLSLRPAIDTSIHYMFNADITANNQLEYIGGGGGGYITLFGRRFRYCIFANRAHYSDMNRSTWFSQLDEETSPGVWTARLSQFRGTSGSYTATNGIFQFVFTGGGYYASGAWPSAYLRMEVQNIGSTDIDMSSMGYGEDIIEVQAIAQNTIDFRYFATTNYFGSYNGYYYTTQRIPTTYVDYSKLKFIGTQI